MTPALPAFLFVLWQIKSLWWFLPPTSAGHYPESSRLKIILFSFSLLIFFLFQFFFPVFQIENFKFQIAAAGYLFIFVGLYFCRRALAALGGNWSNLINYQIKKNQQLITTGIYAKIRHPLYFGDILWLTGLEMTFASWLFIPLFILLAVLFSRHSIKEDRLLENHFGQQYRDYKKKTGF